MVYRFCYNTDIRNEENKNKNLRKTIRVATDAVAEKAERKQK